MNPPDPVALAQALIRCRSVTPDDETWRRMIAATQFRLIPRGLAGFAPLSARAGFSVAKVEQAWLSEQVLLRPC